MSDEKKIISLEGLAAFKTKMDESVDAKIAGSVNTQYTLTKNNDGEIILTGTDGSVTKVTDSNTTYGFSQNGTTLTITPSTGDPITITLGEEITAEKITTALGFIPLSINDVTDTYNAEGTSPVSGKAVASALAGLPEPMVFKGSLGTGGTITALPTASKANTGYTYKVITNGTYAEQSAKVGDTFISDGSVWTLIPSGDEPSGTVTSVGVSVPTGFSVKNSPITTSGTISISMASGYSIPTTAKQNVWDTAITVSSNSTYEELES